MPGYKEEKQKKDYARALEIAEGLPAEFRKFITAMYNSGRSASTVLNYAYDISVFFSWYKEYDPEFSGMETKDISAASLRTVDVSALNEFENFLICYESTRTRRKKRNPDGSVVRDAAGLEVWENADMSNCLRSRKRKFSALSSFFKYLCSTGVLESNPVAERTATKLEAPVVDTYLDAKESGILLDGIASGNCDGMTPVSRRFKYRFRNRDYAIVAVLLMTGIRISELVGLDLSDIDWGSRCFRVIRKGHRENTDRVYFSEDVQDALLAYINGSAVPEGTLKKIQKDAFAMRCWRFIQDHGTSNSFDRQVEKEFGSLAGDAAGIMAELEESALTALPRSERAKRGEDALFVSNIGTRISVRTVQIMVKDYIHANLIGPIEGDVQHSSDVLRMSKVTVHKLRTSYAVRLANGDVPVPVATLQALLGHSSSAVTSKYYISIEDGKKRDVNRALPIPSRLK